jgi:glycosyltransferase involved in cell wall biosynthesis
VRPGIWKPWKNRAKWKAGHATGRHMKSLFELREGFARLFRKGGTRIEPRGKSRGTVVISYITWPFREGWDSLRGRGHTNAYEVVVMAEAFTNEGFRVEVTDWKDRGFILPDDCRVVVDLHANLGHWQSRIPKGCKRILHATGMHWLTANLSELERLRNLSERKGVDLLPRRQVEPTESAGIADGIVVLGNQATIDSYRFSGKPVTRVPISSAYEFSWPADRDEEKARTRFLWLGSYGMVHKGLDLVLEAFSRMPELGLTVCGRPEKEEDFYRLYQKELQNTPNIRLQGWVDMASEEFKDIACSHASVVYPSCSEGGAGSVIHCMHAGMLPVCTDGASVDLGDFGVRVQSGTVQHIMDACRLVASLPAAEVRPRARAAYEHVRTVHTRERFRENYRKFAERITEGIL